MSFEVTLLYSGIFGYAIISVLLAVAGRYHWVPERWSDHPAAQTFALTTFSSLWALTGAIGLAYQQGYNFLTFYLGFSGAFLLAPIVLAPILKLTQIYRLSSLADLFAFRYCSRTVGTLVSLLMLIGILPFLSLQFQGIHQLLKQILSENVSIGICALLAVLVVGVSWLIGTQHTNQREKHRMLIIWVGVQGAVTFVCLGAVTFYAVKNSIGGFSQIDSWLATHPGATNILYEPLAEGPWRALLLTFFAGSILMPHMHHLLFTENSNPKGIRSTSWSVPIVTLLMALCIPPLLWSGIQAQVAHDPEVFLVAVPRSLGSPLFAIIGLIGAIAGAISVLLIGSLAISSMIINHVVLPWHAPPAEKNLYVWLRQTKRLVLLIVIAVSFGVFLVLHNDVGLTELMLIAFVLSLQFIPGLMGTLYWSRATRRGFLSGLMLGVIIWAFSMLLPMLARVDALPFGGFDLGFTPSVSNWQAPTFFSIFFNSVLFFIVSRLSQQSTEEKAAAESCCVTDLRRPYQWTLETANVADFIQQLSRTLGTDIAQREVTQALQDLSMNASETRPYMLRRLRDQIEANLSGLMGPVVARDVINKALPYASHGHSDDWEDIHFIEDRIESQAAPLTGLAAELDHLRRFHRQILQNLPVGVSTVSASGEIVSWNNELERITEIQATDVVGSKLSSLPDPWSSAFGSCLDHASNHAGPISLKTQFRQRWIVTHQALLDHPAPTETQMLLLVVEDITDSKLLEEQVQHSQRLASIGQLAAGVAHEIGNPLTGIDCLAQELQHEDDPKISQQLGKEILGQTKRISSILQSLMNFSRGHGCISQGFIDVHLAPCVDEVINLLRLNPKYKQTNFHSTVAPEHTVLGDPQRIQQVLINLLTNAADASKYDGEILISSETKKHFMAFTIEDQGTGISPDMLGKVFDPFVTTKPPGEGTGLGLSVTYSIVREHGGEIRIESPVTEPKLISGSHIGTRVTVFIPRPVEESL
ncbi:MAG: ATP-binding protein [Pseudomonadota bacterium]